MRLVAFLISLFRFCTRRQELKIEYNHWFENCAIRCVVLHSCIVLRAANNVKSWNGVSISFTVRASVWG